MLSWKGIFLKGMKDHPVIRKFMKILLTLLLKKMKLATRGDPDEKSVYTSNAHKDEIENVNESENEKINERKMIVRATMEVKMILTVTVTVIVTVIV